jgi:hypothetical protein
MTDIHVDPLLVVVVIGDTDGDIPRGFERTILEDLLG